MKQWRRAAGSKTPFNDTLHVKIKVNYSVGDVPYRETYTQSHGMMRVGWGRISLGRVASSFPRRLLTVPSSKECQVPIYCLVNRESFSVPK